MSKEKKLMIGSGVVVLVLIIAIILFFALRKVSTIKIDNKENNSVVVSANNASSNSGGVGYVTLNDGQKINIEADLKNDKTIKIEISKNKTDKTLVTKEFKKDETKEYKLSQGEYAIHITAQKGATGKLKINVK